MLDLYNMSPMMKKMVVSIEKYFMELLLYVCVHLFTLEVTALWLFWDSEELVFYSAFSGSSSAICFPSGVFQPLSLGSPPKHSLPPSCVCWFLKIQPSKQCKLAALGLLKFPVFSFKWFSS